MLKQTWGPLPLLAIGSIGPSLQPSSPKVLGAEKRQHHVVSPRHWKCRAESAGGRGHGGGRGGRQEHFKDVQEIADLFP